MLLMCRFWLRQKKKKKSSLNDGVLCQRRNEELGQWLNCNSWCSRRISAFYSTWWRKGFPSFQFQVKSSRNLTVIRFLEDIESQAESRNVITFWSKGQESQSSAALIFVFWISMLAWGFYTDSGTIWSLFGFLEERNWTSATWWENILAQRSQGII